MIVFEILAILEEPPCHIDIETVLGLSGSCDQAELFTRGIL